MFGDLKQTSFLLVLVLPGAGMLVAAGISAWRRSIVLRRWPAVIAEVVSAEVEALEDSEGGWTYRPRVTFRYNAGGREMMETWRRSWSTSNRTGNERYVARHYAGGAKCEIRVHPKNPAKIQCEVAASARYFAPSLIIAGVGALFVLGGVLFLVFV